MATVYRKGPRPRFNRAGDPAASARGWAGHCCRSDGQPWAGAGHLESRRVRYNGQGFSLKGEKDRFVLPPDFRKALKESGDGEKTLCVQLHATLPCLIGFGPSREDELDALLDREEENALKLGQQFDRLVRSSQLFGFLKVPFDDSGRFVLPPRFVKGASITDRLYFQGAGAEFLIFNPDELMKLGEGWRHAQLACDDLAEQAAAKARK